MRQELNSLLSLFDKAEHLEEVISTLESKVQSIQMTLNTKHQTGNWLVLSEAAKKVGLTTSALRQRIKRDHYPEGQVWRQKEAKSTIFINLVKLEEYL